MHRALHPQADVNKVYKPRKYGEMGIFISELFVFTNKAKLANFADDNTIYV